MIDFLLTILAGVGLTFVVTRSKIFKPLREWVTAKSLRFGELVTCPQCFGVYAGMVSYLLVKFNLDILVYGLIVSVACLFLSKKI